MLESIFGNVAARAIRRGLQRGSTPWVSFGVLAAGWAILRRLARSGRQHHVAAVEELTPGSSIIIRAFTDEEIKIERTMAAAAKAASKIAQSSRRAARRSAAAG